MDLGRNSWVLAGSVLMTLRLSRAKTEVLLIFSEAGFRRVAVQGKMCGRSCRWFTMHKCLLLRPLRLCGELDNETGAKFEDIFCYA